MNNIDKYLYAIHMYFVKLKYFCIFFLLIAKVKKSSLKILK